MMSTTTVPARAAVPRAALPDALAVGALVLAPNLAQGLFARRPAVVRAAAAAGVDGAAVRQLSAMASRSTRPVRVGGTVLLLDPRDADRVLEGPVDVYAGDPDPKRRGMAHFQPGAVTISRGEAWRERRRFTDAVLASAPALAPRVAECVAEEIARLPARTGWRPWNRAFQRIARRIVLGDEAAGDDALSVTLEGMMAEANRLPRRPSRRLPAFRASVEGHLERAEPGSLAAAIADTPAGPDTEPCAQVTHWLFALGDTLAANALRALAVLGQRPADAERALAEADHAAACLQETMRLWPTTPMLSRETRAEVVWDDGTVLPAGTRILVVNTFFHRDPAHVPDADAFVPERWLEGTPAGVNHFSRGPQRCAGADLAVLTGREALRAALMRTLTIRTPRLPPEPPMPYALDHFRIEAVLA
ncbi:cytochrome P450 [Amycolatopsis sp. NPDC006131]|uniref:cytochrome P450 n=1 Tax=Amycolatopsis sp. NPDC006131 TaxID=3156731 RepID=UPI0033A4D5DA